MNSIPLAQKKIVHIPSTPQAGPDTSRPWTTSPTSGRSRKFKKLCHQYVSSPLLVPCSSKRETY